MISKKFSYKEGFFKRVKLNEKSMFQIISEKLVLLEEDFDISKYFSTHPLEEDFKTFER